MVFNPDGRTVMCAMQDSLKVILGFRLLNALLEHVKCWSFLSHIFFLYGISQSGYHTRFRRSWLNIERRPNYINHLRYGVATICILGAGSSQILDFG